MVKEKEINIGSKRTRLSLDFVSKGLHLKGLGLEQKITRVLFLISCLLVALSSFTWAFVFLGVNLGGTVKKGMVFFIFLSVVGCTLFVFFILYVIFNIYEILIAVTCLCLLLGCDFIHFYQQTGALDGFILSYTSFIPISVLLMSYRKIHKFFWIVVYFSNLVIAFSFEFWWTDRNALGKFVEGDTFYILISGSYFDIFFPICIFLLVIVFFVVATEKKKKLVEKITKSIADLDTESKYPRKLKFKKLIYCTDLEKKFKAIINHVENYKCYLPSALIAIKDEESSDGNNTSESGSVADSVISSEKKIEVLEQNSIFVKKVNVSLLMCKICNMNSFVGKNDQYEDYLSVHSKFTEIVHGVSVKNRGVMHEICSDKIIISFNSELRCVNHEEHCCDSSLRLLKCLKNEKTLQNVEFQIICISDSMLYGSIGFEMKKKFSFIGENYERLFKIEKRDLPGEKVYIDENTYFGVKYKYVLCQVEDKVKTREKVYEVKDKKKINTGEWIYEIGDNL